MNLCGLSRWPVLFPFIYGAVGSSTSTLSVQTPLTAVFLFCWIFSLLVFLSIIIVRCVFYYPALVIHLSSPSRQNIRTAFRISSVEALKDAPEYLQTLQDLSQALIRDDIARQLIFDRHGQLANTTNQMDPKALPRGAISFADEKNKEMLTVFEGIYC